MKKLLTIACLSLLGVLLLNGCTATKIKYEKDEAGKVEYSIWHNGHWMKTEAETLGGGMTRDGQFSINLSGVKSSPSEEFARAMKVYMDGFAQLAQIAAAAYNPSASSAIQGATQVEKLKSTEVEKSESSNPPTSPSSAKATEGEQTSQTEPACTNGACVAK